MTKLEQIMKSNPTWGRGRLVAAGFGPSAVRRALEARNGHHATPTAKSRGVSLSNMLAAIDYTGQVRKALNRLCRKTFVVEIDFRIASGVPAIPFRRVADSGEFDDCRVKHNGQVYWSLPANIAEFKRKQEEYR